MSPPTACPVALTIAGSDSGGGAGIQADLKTFHQLGVFGTSAITAITAQNTTGVTRWAPVDPDLVRAQIEAVAADLSPAAIKTGMLGTAANVKAVAAAIREHRLPNFVLDPVMAASSGHALAAEDMRLDDLIPLAEIITPNLDEAEALTGLVVRDVAAMERAARALIARGARAALVKGGHLESGMLVDVLVTGDGPLHRFEHARIASRHTHGTGCTLSAALTAELAKGATILNAAETAIGFVQRAIATAPGLGAGRGPLSHW